MDLAIVQRLNHFGAGTRWDQISYLVSWSPMLIGVFILICGIGYRKIPQKRRQIVGALLIGVVLFFLVNELLCKHILIDYTGIRPRPYIAHPELISPLGKQFSDSSFPSSHMASTTMIMVFLVWMFPISRHFALIFVFAMAFSRMHNGMHYPSDVIVGSLLGVIYGIVAIKTSKMITKFRK